MLFFPSPAEGLARIEISDAAWEARFDELYAAAVKRGENEPAEEDDTA